MEFPPGRIVFQVRCRDYVAGQSASRSNAGRESDAFEAPAAPPRSWIRAAFAGASAHFAVWCDTPEGERLVVNELLGTAWENDGASGLHDLAGCGRVRVNTGGRSVR